MRYSKLGYFGLPAAALGLMAAGLPALNLLPAGPSWTRAVLLCLVSAAAMGLALASYRHADEIILGQHKTAWFWGSMIACSISLPFVVSYSWNLLQLPISNNPHIAFSMGFVFLWVMQGLCFLALRLITRLRGRA